MRSPYTFNLGSFKVGTHPLETASPGHALQTGDQPRRLEREIDAQDQTTQYAYNDAGQLISVTDPLTHTTQLDYDDYGRLEATTDARNHTTWFTYNPDSTLLNVTNPVSYTVQYQYDDLRRVIGVTDNVGHAVSYSLDAYGNPLAVTDALGRVKKYDYDRRGLLEAVVENYNPELDPDNETNVRTEYSYDLVGNLTAVKDPRGYITHYDYDDLDRLWIVTDPLSNQTVYGYDPLSNLTSIQYPNGYTTILDYDPVDRLDSIDYQNDSILDVTFEYDPLGRMTDMDDSLGHTHWAWDVLGRITAITDPFDQTVGYDYDAAGNRTRLTYPNGRNIVYQYDETNLLRHILENAVSIADYDYDAANRLTGVSLANGVDSVYTYDASGQILNLTHEDPAENLLASYDYEYDLVGNRAVVTETLFAPYHEIKLPLVLNGYESGGGEAMTGGEESSKEPADPYPGPPEKVPAPPDDGEKDPADPYPPPETEKEGSTFWQKLIEFFTRILAWVTPEAKAYSQPVRVAPSLLPAVLESGEPGDGSRITTTIRYDYDPLNRLTDANYGDNWGYTYSYDAVGNRTSRVSPQGTTSYDYDIANRLTDAGGVAYTWDDNGNLTYDGVYTYTYSHANRLVAVIDASSSTSYVYSGLGDRVSQSVDGNTTYYSLDLAAGLTQVLDDGDNAYLYGLVRIGEEQPGGWVFHHGDALGSVRQLTDGNGEVALVRSYQPYGEVLASSGDGETSYSYTGEWADASGLIFLRARFYSPWDGRFLSQDVWEGDYSQPMSYNGWLYGYANPVMMTDPSGMVPVDCSQINVALQFSNGLRTLCEEANGDLNNDPNDINTIFTLMARKQFFREIAGLSKLASNVGGMGYWYAGAMLDFFLDSVSYVSINLSPNSTFISDPGIVRATKIKADPVAGDDAEEIIPLLYVFLNNVKQSNICGVGIFPDLDIPGKPYYLDPNPADRSPRPVDKGWWGAFGHVNIDARYSNNRVIRAADGYLVESFVTYTIEDKYVWGNKLGTPLPLGPIKWPHGSWRPQSLMSMVGNVEIPHEWEESLRDYRYANEYDFTISWVENLHIRIDKDFTTFSIPSDNIFNVVLGE